MASNTTTTTSGVAPAEALAALGRYFGYDSFRPGQEGMVSAILGGRDALGVMPTGAGKSICYQIPAALLPGVTVVVSPLISLMRDQVDALNEIGLSAAFVNATQSSDEQAAVLATAAAGGVRLLYVAPERLETERFREFAVRVPISLVAVDEAHCVSQWGQDFRSSYLGIGDFIASLPTRPVVAAFTATATERVRRDIVTLLGLRDPVVAVTGFDRPNLYFDVIRMESKRKDLWVSRYVAEHRGESGIVYCATRKETEELSAVINRSVGISGDDGAAAVAYHGGMAPDERERAQRAFVTDRVPVVVATNAFGMGIDKSNVRYVIHHNMPESIEAYYQEAGRAGRDGEPSRCTLLWNEGDIVTRRRLLDMGGVNDRLSDEEREAVRMSKRRLLDGMVGYCRTTECLHRYITRYFGEPDGNRAMGRESRSPAPESGSRGCGRCVNCAGTFAVVDVTDIARAVSRCVHDLNQSFGAGRIVAVLRGSRSRDVLDRGLDRCPSYGMLRDVPEARIRDVLGQMATDGLLFITEGRLPVVHFGARAAETVAPDFHYEIKRMERRDGSGAGTGRVRAGSSASERAVAGMSEQDDELFERLRALRRRIAQEIGKPPYIVFSDRSLRDMCVKRPATPDEFLAVSGVGENKLRLYGDRFLDVISGNA